MTGHAIAGGLVLALCADLRNASLAGRYGLTEVKVGVPCPQAAVGVVRAGLPRHAARRLALGNQLVDGAEALRLGLCDEALSPERAFSRAFEVATEMAALRAALMLRPSANCAPRTAAALKAAAESEPLLEGWLSADRVAP